MHDFNPGIASSGLFWTVRLSDGALSTSGNSARLRVENFPVVDSFVFLGPTEVPATVSFDVTWTATGGVTHFTPGSSDPTDPTNFEGEFRLATATGSFSGRNSDGFKFSAANSTSEGVFAEMGKERNGVFLKK